LDLQVGRGKSQNPGETSTVGIRKDQSSSQQTSPSIGATLSSEPRNSCWNFPKVKFRRIFNAKSLDDILGRGLPTTSSSSKSSSCVSPEISLPSGSSSSARNDAPLQGVGAASDLVDEDGNLSSSIPPNKSKPSSSSISSLKIYNPNPNLSHQGVSSISSGSIGSGSESGGGGNKSKGKSLVSVFQRIPQFHSSGNKDSTCSSTSDGKTTKKSRKKGSSSCSGGEKPSKSLSSGSLNRVSAAKSDNYLNRIVVSATCAKFTAGKSTDNLATATTSQSDTHKCHSAIKNKKKSSSSTLVEAFSTSSNEASGGSEVSNQPQQRRWTAVKHKWDLKLQQSQVPPGDPSSNPNSSTNTSNNKSGDAAIFIKSQLSQISGVSSASLLQGAYEDNPTRFLESCGTTASNSLQDVQPNAPYIPTKPHEAGRVKFCLEPEEIPLSPTISRSQSSDCRPIQVDPSLIGIIDSSNQDVEEESEEMTKSRHFHYSTNSSGGGGGASGGSKLKGGRQNAKDHLDSSGEGPKSSGGGTFQLTSKDIKAQLVVANVSYLQRPTSPCLLISPGDSSSSNTINPQSSSSPGVFSPNNNFVSGALVQSAGRVTSPVQSQISTYHQTRMMKHEYLTSGSGSIAFLSGGSGGGGAIRTNNLNERQIKENINRGQTAPGGGGSLSSGGHSSFVVPSCVNRNDVISSPPPTGSRRLNSSTFSNEPGGANKTITKESQYGSGGGDRVGQEQDDYLGSHDDTFIYTNRYKEDYTNTSKTNKNVASHLEHQPQSSSSRFHLGERGDYAEEQMQSGDFSFDSGCSNMSGDYVG